MNDLTLDLILLLNEIELEMQRIALWQGQPPEHSTFLSEQPFALDTMESYQWLQWIFLPRMRAIIDANADIPRNFMLYPYFEEALKKEDLDVLPLLMLIKRLDDLVK